MRIRAERDDLVDVLGRAGRAVGARAALPVLQGLHLEVAGRTLKVTGTDLDVTIRTELQVEVLSPGVAVAPAKLTTEAIRKLPPGAVTFQAEGGEIEISGGGPVFRFREFSTADYPKLAEPSLKGAVTVDGPAFSEAISQVSVAASTDDARPVLTGVFFEAEGGRLRMVATDSYRLAVCDLPAVEAGLTGLVPVRALRELARTVSAGSLKVAVSDREAAFSSERGVLTARLIEGAFPNYRTLIPASYPNRLKVGRQPLLDAIDRASLVAEDHIPIRITLQKGGIELSVTRQDVGGEVEHVEAEYSGEEMTIAFNSKYLNDGVGAIDDDLIALDVLDPLKPGVLRGADSGDFLYLLMPVRL